MVLVGLGLTLGPSAARSHPQPCRCITGNPQPASSKPMPLRVVLDLSTSVLSASSESTSAIEVIEGALKALQRARCVTVKSVTLVPGPNPTYPPIDLSAAINHTHQTKKRLRSPRNRYSPLVDVAKTLGQRSRAAPPTEVGETLWITDMKDCPPGTPKARCAQATPDRIAHAYRHAGGRDRLSWFRVGIDVSGPTPAFVDHAELADGRFNCGQPDLCAIIADDLSPERLDTSEFRFLPTDALVSVRGAQGGLCTGSRLTPTKVLTARHCLPARSVAIGFDVFSTDDARVIAVDLPPNPTVDAAVLTVDRPLTGKRMPLRQASDDAPPTSELIALGFGARNPRGQRGAGYLRAVALNGAGWHCRSDDAHLLGCTPAFEMVVNRSGGADTCDGDSGGPLLEPRPAGAVIYQRTAQGCSIESATPDSLPPWVNATREPVCSALQLEESIEIETCSWRQVGLTSRPVARSRRRCGDGGVYLRIDRLRPWLDTIAPELRESE